MNLGAPISDVEVTIIEAPESETESTDNSTSGDNSTSSNDTSNGNSSSSNSSDSSSSSGNKKFKLITGGQVTVPGYNPIVLSDAFYVPRLL